MHVTSKLKVRSSSALKHKIAMAGFTSKKLAEIVDITPNYLSQIIQGKASPSPIRAQAIIDALSARLGESFTIGDFFFDVSVKKNATNFVSEFG